MRNSLDSGEITTVTDSANNDFQYFSELQESMDITLMNESKSSITPEQQQHLFQEEKKSKIGSPEIPSDNINLSNTFLGDMIIPCRPQNITQEDDEENEEYVQTLHELQNKWFEDSQRTFANISWYKRPSLSFLYFIIALYLLSSTITMGPLLMLTQDKICEGIKSSETVNALNNIPSLEDNAVSMAKRMGMTMPAPEDGMASYCDPTLLQKSLSNLQTSLSIVSGILGFVLSGKYGQWSDKYGRVFVFKIFSLINLLHVIVLIFYFQDKIYSGSNRELMFFVLAIGSLSGGVMSLIAIGNGYINDIVMPHIRTISISLLMSIVYGILGVGPLLGSFIVKFISHGNNLVPLYFSLGIGILSTLLTYFFMYESRHPHAMEFSKLRHDQQSNNVATGGTDSNFVKIFFYRCYYRIFVIGFLSPLKKLWVSGAKHKDSSVSQINVICLIIIDILSMANTVGIGNVMILYSMLTFNWDSVKIGYLMSLGGFGRVFVLLIIGPMIIKFLELKVKFPILTTSVDRIDKVCLTISLVFVLLSTSVVLIINKEYGIYLGCALQSLSGMISPTIQGSIIKYGNNLEAGEMFAAIALIRHLSMLLLPTFFLQIYSHTVDFCPKFFMFISLLGSIVTLIICLIFLKARVAEDDEV
ncbi:uncharacterized protein SCODWIG_02502 [Saccharomycodes ludwigii]|uniref:Major facilitator superfamily (MFS) profile domain-containing protein n=1 Tax=Saccharomycodes ludwigii TaxID=36035 RepID=A0A376B803_9ASCO|nr:hypothetical protein SCDLUD_002413 [Saccharomycodes ludwigii]KAH3900951.1 hypothetical protein SCDLUD_002413 [Saccharomycodes ludwigii]SSD60741.1 uncharacterized protein SCODWIG_02502 [Saccharomycodes ludwigii]